METKKSKGAKGGGRPPKAVKRDQHLAVKCSYLESKMIERKAKVVCLSVSEYLREQGLKGQVDRLVKVLPKEVLLFTGTLNHLASNLNQIAHRRNRGEELSALERAVLVQAVQEVKNLVGAIKNYLQ